MPKRQSAPPDSPDSLTASAYDAWALRTTLIAHQRSTASYPGDVVFSTDPGQPRLAFTQLGSYGVTYAGMGLDKTAAKTWKLLKHAGLSVPRYRAFGRDKEHEAQEFARKNGFPVVVAAASGAPHRQTRRRLTV